MIYLSKSIWVAVFLFVLACTDSNEPNSPSGPASPNNSNNNEWNIPKNEVFDGGPGKDGIPALTMPDMISASEATYLKNDDLVIGYKRGDDVRAYPHPILDWHEIINDEVDGHLMAIIYCPLTGTGTGWERRLNGSVTTFGVSGLLYNTNIIPYDRLTNSNWSQIRLDCVNGSLRGKEAQTFHTVETTWETWKALFPQTKVVSTQTGFNRNYGVYPYGSYKINHDSFLFPHNPKDSRLPGKERVLGVINGGEVKAYRFDSFEGDLIVVEDNFFGTDLVIAGSKPHNFLVAFTRKANDGTKLSFTAASFDQGMSSGILVDSEGSTWNIFGEAISGPREGQKLIPVVSFIGYWFSWGAFYPEPEIFE
jgi:hypothetical protein